MCYSILIPENKKETKSSLIDKQKSTSTKQNMRVLSSNVLGVNFSKHISNLQTSPFYGSVENGIPAKNWGCWSSKKPFSTEPWLLEKE